MTVHDHADQARLPFIHFASDGRRALVLRLRIKNFDRVTAIEHIAADKAAPQWRLDGAQLGSQVLVDQFPATRINE